jgi:hypothetical protein
MAHGQEGDLWQLKTGAAVLATCIVQTLDESDPSFEKRFLANLGRAYDQVQERHPDRKMRDVLELLSWTRELLTGWSPSGGQGKPLLK